MKKNIVKEIKKFYKKGENYFKIAHQEYVEMKQNKKTAGAKKLNRLEERIYREAAGYYL